jgi:hypothetical protein
MERRAAAAAGPIFIAVVLSAFAWFAGCSANAPESPASPERPAQFESTGEEFLISALDELERIADLAGVQSRQTIDLRSISSLFPSRGAKRLIAATTTDTTFIYGEVTPGGYGAVVTERHAYPKGLLLITVRRSYGKPPARVVTETKRYISFPDFLNDSTQQSNITELYGLSSDTIVTHVTRNGILETYTFRLPVITRVTNPVDGSVRVTLRYGSGGSVRSEIRDGDGNLVQFRDTYGDSTGAITTYTEFADASWRNVRTLGQSDGSVLRDITSGP